MLIIFRMCFTTEGR